MVWGFFVQVSACSKHSKTCLVTDQIHPSKVCQEHFIHLTNALHIQAYNNSQFYLAYVIIKMLLKPFIQPARQTQAGYRYMEHQARCRAREKVTDSTKISKTSTNADPKIKLQEKKSTKKAPSKYRNQRML